MQKTHLDLVRHYKQVQDSYYWGPDYGYWYGGLGYRGFGYGWPYGYGGWNLGPTIVFRGGGGEYHGGGNFHGGGGFHGGGHGGR